MGLKLVTAPATEPITLAEAKSHLRIESTSFSDDFTPTQTIAAGAHAIGSINGAAVDVLGITAVAVLDVGTVAGILSVHLEESNDGSTWTDVTSGAFTAITSANDNQSHKLAYTGAAQYIRAVGVTAGGAADYGVTVAKDAASSPDDVYITSLIKVARTMAEEYTERAFITQTWDLYLDNIPSSRFVDLDSGQYSREYPWSLLPIDSSPWLDIPRAPLQSATVYYYPDTDVQTVFPATSYHVDTISEPGRIGLKNGSTWPSDLRSMNGIQIRFVAGYGAASAVPDDIKTAIKLIISHLYENRTDAGDIPMAARMILQPYRMMRV